MSVGRRVLRAVVGSALLVAGLGAVASPSSQAQPQLIPAAQPAGAAPQKVYPGFYYERLQSVAAVSATDVWGAGEYGWSGSESATASDVVAMVQHWDGTAWSVTTLPKVHGPSALNGIAADGADDVWAVGSTGRGTLAEHFDGTGWSVSAAPATTGGGLLNAIAAVDANDVWAVGRQGGGHTLAEHWDGTTWSVVSGAQTSCTGSTTLTGVAAISGTDAWAVGRCVYLSDREHQVSPIIEHWDGSSWSQVQSPTPNGSLTAVSASATDDVWAVGHTPSGPDAEHWDGSEWTDVSVPASGNPYRDALESIETISATNAWSVGESSYDPETAVISHWNGIVWKTVSVESSARFDLFGLAATSSGDVWSVGSLASDQGHPMRTLALHFDGNTWTSVPTPSPGARDNGSLQAVSADSSTDAWAVGVNNYRLTPLIEHWDGATWTLVPSPNPGGTTRDNSFDAVVALSPQDVWALGRTGTGGQTSDVLAEHWNGTTWKKVAAPNPGNSYHIDYFTSVIALSPHDIWAAGEEEYGGMSWVEHWDGHTWTVSYQSPFDGSELTSMDAISADDVWAVGIASAGGGPQALHWDGQSWTSQDRGLPEGFDWLTAVTSPSAGVVYASGTSFGYDYRWTGTKWTAMAQGTTPTGWQYGISADSATEGWSVGSTDRWVYGDAEIAGWDGTQWSQVANPTPAMLVSTGLANVVAVTASQAWAVGTGYDRAGLQYPLVQEWDGTSWSTVLPR